jgi:membrane-associated phospholipid phosphatase
MNRSGMRGQDTTALRLMIGPMRIRATDGLILSALALISLLAIVFHRRVEGWWLLALKNLGAGAAYLVLDSFGERWTNPFRRFFLRMVNVMLAFAYINVAVEKLQLIIYGRWLDDAVLKMENTLFGLQPTLWMQHLISKPLTEWMMFAYVFYLPMLLGLGCVIFFRRGESATEVYFFTLCLSNVICDLSFMLFPVAGPIFHMGAQYTVPLDGYVWTRLGEALRHHVQFVGGTIPSPHCANATIMWLTAYRFHLPSFWTLSPIVISMYVSTVYCRFHYATDVVVGVAAALLVLAVVPVFLRRWNKLAEGKEKRSPSLLVSS